MRATVTTLTAVLMLAAGSSYAQQAATPPRSEGPFSPFTYEALGATPSIRLPRLGGSAERKAAADAKAQAALKSPAAVGTEDAAQAAAARAESPSSLSATPTAARPN